MDWAGLNKTIMAAVGAAHRAGLPYLGRELYSLGNIETTAQFRSLQDRVATVKALLRLRPAAPQAWRKCGKEFEDLYREVELGVKALS